MAVVIASNLRKEIGGSLPYTIWFSALEPDEICDLAGISEKAFNIRTAVKRAYFAAVSAFMLVWKMAIHAPFSNFQTDPAL